ncbi:MAG: hypothetical protein M3144_07475, partial [Actinomycetota bacterium]|nr:hypothetical protein [Actinomycetota bacterium]
VNDFVTIAAESRTNTAVIDPTVRTEGGAAGQTTEINEPGPEVSPGEVERLAELGWRRLRVDQQGFH